MQFDSPLTEARLIKRYKRFLADVILPSGDVVVAHCANSGSMQGCMPEGARVLLSKNTNPKAKLDWRWEMVEIDGALVGINTSHPNAIVAEAINTGRIPELAGYSHLRREVKYGTNSRIDILLSNHDTAATAKSGKAAEKDQEKSQKKEKASGTPENGQAVAAAKPLCYVEVKNVTLKEGDMALFPDAVTTRGEKHLRALMAEVANGNRAVMVYLINRPDCVAFSAAERVDPVYAARLKEAMAAGVEVLAYACTLSHTAIEVAHRLPVQL